MKYFLPTPGQPILMGEQVTKFWELIITSNEKVRNAEQATELLEELFTAIQEDVRIYNQEFLRKFPKAWPMHFHWDLYNWGKIKHASGISHYICGDTPYTFFIGEGGGIEVHRIEQGKHPAVMPLFYKRKKRDALTGMIFSRQSATFVDAWGRPLTQTIEFFTDYNLQRQIT